MFNKFLTAPGRSFPRPVIIVTGPQRSGTRIAAKMIAADVGYEFVDEREFSINDLMHARERVTRSMFRCSTRGVVLQAPGLCHLTHLFWDTELFSGPVAVLMMMRDTDAIRASEKRINWPPEGEIKSYLSRPEFAPYLTKGASVAEWKYDVWRHYQRPLIQRLCGDGFYYSIQYEELCNHELWVPAEDRTGKDWQWDTTERGTR